MNRRDVLAACMLAACLVALLLPLAPIGVDPHHDGIMMKPALDVLSGKVLFRDSFTQYGALTAYLQSLTLAVQPSLLAVRLMTVGAYAATLLCLYAAWRLVLPCSLTVVAGVLYLLFIPAYETDPWNHEHWMLLPWSSVYAMMFQAAGLYALFRVIRGEQPERWGLVLGLACAAVFWCRQPVGVMMTGSLIAIWPALHWTGWMPAQSSKRTILGRILVGFLALHAVLFGGLALSGALPAWWHQNIAWPARWSQSIIWMDTLPFFVNPAEAAGMTGLVLAFALPSLAKRFRPKLPVAIWAAYFVTLAGVLIWQHARVLRIIAVRDGGWSFVMPLVLVGFVIGVLVDAVRRRGAAQPVEYYLSAAWAAFGLGSLVQYYPMGDSWHMFYTLTPVFGLVVFVVWRWSGRSVPVVAAGFAAVLLPAVYVKARLIPPVLNRPLVTLAKPALLRGMKVPPEQARYLDQIADTLALVELLHPDMPAVLIGNDALYLCFMRNQATPIPYYVTWQGLANQQENLQRWDYIHRTRPVLILEKARWEAVDDFYRRARYLPVLFVPEELLEIAIPQELADAAGLKIYGIFGLGRPRPKVQP
ncbi:MAG: hypothetical protein HYX71_08185 [Opitutae bacterium]|nr:hypothetical protein [Opitutae bacterium]